MDGRCPEPGTFRDSGNPESSNRAFKESKRAYSSYKRKDLADASYGNINISNISKYMEVKDAMD